MNIARKILSKTARTLDLPADVLAGLPKLELVGFAECSVEPHKGLIEYGEHAIIVDSNMGRINIRGKDLFVRRMNHRSITVCGTIFTVEWQGDCNHG